MSSKPYRSPLRAAQAATTRQHICDAARSCFEAEGFAATTVTTIARRAGVSPATVYATFESKAGIVGALLDRLEHDAGMGWRIPEMLQEDDPHRLLELFVAGNRALFEQGHGVLRAASDAAGLPEVRALIDAGNANRRRGVDAIVERWQGQGALRPGLDTAEAAATMWLLTGFEHFLLAVDALGWTADAYERWLRELLDRTLLAPAG